MGIERLCSTMKERLAAELLELPDPSQREVLLIEALYELSRSVLPELGIPKKSQEYQDRLAVVLDLVSFIVIPLIKCAEDRRGVAVLSELAEGCHDPQLRKKFSIYAQELLAKIETQGRPDPPVEWKRVGWAAGASTAALASVITAWSLYRSDHLSEGAPHPTTEQDVSSTNYHASAPAPVIPATVAPSRGGDERSADERPVSEQNGKVTVQGEQVTRVRVLNNQVLVPVTLKNGGESVRVELVLDTGATRTAVHEYLAGKLRIDLKAAKLSQAEVADGRIIVSRVARVDSLVVGPFAMPGVDVDLIPYRGADGVHDGLLGMDFLGRHRYQIDMEKELIRWF